MTMVSFVRVTAMVAAIALGTGLVLSTTQQGGPTGPGAAPAAELPSPTPSPSFATSSEVTGLAVSVTGTTSDCTSTPGTKATMEGIEQVRDMVETCTWTMSDPRVSGRSTNHIDWDHPQVGFVMWGTLEIEGPDGIWVGTWISLDPDVVLVLAGTGAYEGWTYVSHIVLGSSPTVDGLIYQGPPPGRWVAATAPTSDVADAGAQVGLGIYSGRPDPTWALTAAETEALDSIIAALPEVVGAPPTGGLGYHGFTVTGSDGVWTAYLGTVARSGEGTRSYRSDPERLVEHFLLETGRPFLAEEEIVEVECGLADYS